MSAVEEELIQRIDEVVAAKRQQSIDMLRAVLNDSGIRRARIAMAEAPTVVANAEMNKVQADTAVQHAAIALDDETAIALRLVKTPFETEGNKTWLVNEDGERVRTILADEQNAIIAALVRKHPAVAAARKRLQDAEHAARSAAVDVSTAKNNLSISKHDVDAAAAELQLAAAIKKEETR